jgi:hypothetical protein
LLRLLFHHGLLIDIIDLEFILDYRPVYGMRVRIAPTTRFGGGDLFLLKDIFDFVAVPAPAIELVRDKQTRGHPGAHGNNKNKNAQI